MTVALAERVICSAQELDVVEEGGLTGAGVTDEGDGDGGVVGAGGEGEGLLGVRGGGEGGGGGRAAEV